MNQVSNSNLDQYTLSLIGFSIEHNHQFMFNRQAFAIKKIGKSNLWKDLLYLVMNDEL